MNEAKEDGIAGTDDAGGVDPASGEHAAVEDGTEEEAQGPLIRWMQFSLEWMAYDGDRLAGSVMEVTNRKWLSMPFNLPPVYCNSLREAKADLENRLRS
jgi:hypothetical protein